MKNECSVVKDLLPLYIENMVSPETAQCVDEHLKSCPSCQKELAGVKSFEGVLTSEKKAVEDRNNTKPFKRMMKRLNRQFYSLSYSLIIFFIFLGFAWTSDEKLLYNSLIMPIVGVFGYYVFRWKAIYKVPLLLLFIDLAVFAFQLIEIGFADTLSWTVLYAIFALLGVTIAHLLHYALKKSRADIKKRMLNLFALCLAITLMAFVGWFANGLVGNPLSKMLARNTAEKHLETQYPNTDYEIEKVSYSFKDVGYYAYVVSPSSMDGNFTLKLSMLGKLTNDDYASRVENHGNVSNRLYFEFREMVDTVLKSYAYPYNVSMGYGSLEFDREADKAAVEGAIDRSKLVNDRFYNVGALGATNGELVLYVDSDTVTAEKAAEILLKTKTLMEQSGISFHSVHFVLRYPPYDAEIPYERPEGKISLEDFLYADVYEDGLIERIEKHMTVTNLDGEDTKN